MKDEIFKEKVGIFSARDIGRTSKERKSGSLGYAEAMLIAYNKKMKTSLHWTKLYTRKNGSNSEDNNPETEIEETDADSGLDE